MIKLEVFATTVDKIATIVNEYQGAGNYNFQIDGSGLSSGVYFAQFNSGSYRQTIKMMLVK